MVPEWDAQSSSAGNVDYPRFSVSLELKAEEIFWDEYVILVLAMENKKSVQPSGPKCHRFHLRHLA